MVTGWYNNSVATFYFLPTTGEMVKSQIMIIDNVFYSFDANGYMTDQNASDSDLTFGSKIAAYATQFIGNPYVYGGTSLTNGADCSGFTQSVMSHFGIKIPRTADQQAIGYDAQQPNMLPQKSFPSTISSPEIWYFITSQSHTLGFTSETG